MQEKKHIIIYLYYSLRDPLCEGLMLSYLKTLKLSNIHFHLVTYEQDKYKMTTSDVIITKKELFDLGITWHPISYLSGRFFMLKKIQSAFKAIYYTRKVKRAFNLRLVCAMATPVGSYVFIASKIFKVPMCQFTFEPHAQIMMQSGRISASSFKYKIAHWLEMKIGTEAEHVVCTSQHMLDDLKKLGAKGKLYRLPTSVDESMNRFSDSNRKRIRESLHLENKCVLIYPGKFGGMYRSESTIQFIHSYLERMENGHAIIITDFSLATIESWIKNHKLDRNKITLLPPVPLIDLPAYLSAADIGLVAYEDFDVRKYCSPVKTGEYLLCGLPYIVQRGTSEDDVVAEQNNVGIVLNTFDKKGLDEKWTQLQSLLLEDKTQLQERCRKIGMVYRGKKNALALLRTIFEKA